MKMSFKIFSLLFGSLIVFITWSFLPAFDALRRENQMNPTLSAFPIPFTPRQDITFLLGNDKHQENPYFKYASQYYRQHPEDQTEFVVDTCQSLLAVRNYLERHAPDNGRAWGKINLVFHSNEWTGMGVPTLPGGKRTTINTLAHAIASDQFAPLPQTVVNACTEMIFHGCALGRNEGLLEALRAAFIPPLGTTELRSSPYFVIFNQGRHHQPTRYLADFWYAFYQTGQKPTQEALVRQLENRYPAATVDWETALAQQAPTHAGAPFHYTFKIPIVWTVTYPDEASRPKVSTFSDQEKWLDDQDALAKIFEEYQIPKAQFSWTFSKLNYTFEDGTSEPAIKAVGFCSVLCILREVEKEQDETNLL